MIAARLGDAAASASSGFKVNWRVTYYASGLFLLGLSALTPHGAEISGLFLGLCVFLLVVWGVGLLVVRIIRQRGGDPSARVGQLWPRDALTAVDRSLLFLTIPIFWAAFAPVKASIPLLAGFWADPYLSSLDRILLGGEAWRLTHAFIGPGGTRVIDVLYALWIPLIILVAFLVAMRGSEDLRARFYIGWAVIWLSLGVGVAFALASAGPTFGGYLGFGFSGLTERLADINAQNPLLAVSARDALWTGYESGSTTTGNGISAAPSLHCAIAFFMAALARRTIWFKPATAYAVVVWIGSVHLGWHYFADGLISLVGVMLLWPLIVRLAGSTGTWESAAAE